MRPTKLMTWARTHKHIVFTNDMDFGALLAMTRAVGPGVVQIRDQDLMSEDLASLVTSILRQH